MEIYGMGEMPKEFVEMLASQLDRGAMQEEVEQQSMDNFFESLDKDQTLSLKKLIYRVNCSSGGSTPPPPLGTFLEGLLVGALRYRFKVCPGCGEDHTASLFEDHTTPPKEPFADLADAQQHEDGTEQPSLFENPDEATSKPEWGTGDDARATFFDVDDLTVGQVKEMGRLSLDDMREVGTNKLLGFECTDCHMQYVSIEDRALRPEGVEGCMGCQHKAKWG